MELERGHQPVPRRPVVDRGEGGVERRRRRQARAADRDRRGQRQGAAAAARHRRGEAIETARADPAAAPAAADGAQARAARRDRAAHRIGHGVRPTRRKHRLNILPRHGVERTRQGARRRSRGGARRARPPEAQRRAALAARRDRASPGRAARADARRAAPHRRMVGRRRRRRRRPSRRLSARRARRRRGRRRVGGAPARGRAPPVVVVRRGRRDRPRRDGERRRDRPRPARLGQHGAPPRRRSAGAVRALARAARGRRHRRVLVPRARARCASCAISTAREGWPTPTPGYIDMHDLGDMLVDAGFADPVLDQETITLRWRSAAALLAELRQLGGNTAPDRFAGLRTRAWRDRLLAALERTRRCRRQHRPQRRSRLRPRLQARAAPARRRAGRGLARRNAGDGAPPPAFVLRRCAKICRFVEASQPSMRLRSPLAAAAGFSRPFRRQQDVSSQLPGISRARSSRVVASLRQRRRSRRQLGAMAAASQLLDDADPAGRLLPLALRLVAGDRRRVLVARRDAGHAVRRASRSSPSARRSWSTRATPATASA